MALNLDNIRLNTCRSMSATERIQHMAMRFPSLQDVPAAMRWNALKLDQWALTASHGERCAVQFLLRVWDQHGLWKCGEFNVFEAMAIWDQEHREAFLAWALNPVHL